MPGPPVPAERVVIRATSGAGQRREDPCVPARTGSDRRTDRAVGANTVRQRDAPPRAAVPMLHVRAWRGTAEDETRQAKRPRITRSEEHTSELQSRPHLV